jgi:drug/metabolite transporter (DMT)-like permease
MAAALIGVALTAGLLIREPGSHTADAAIAPRMDASRGVAWALLAATTYGATFWALGFHVTPALGGIAPVWIIRVVVIAMLTALAAPLGQSIRLPASADWKIVALIGFLDTGGLVAVARGAHGDQTAIVGVLSSLFSAVTVLLAWIFLRERLAASQWIGIVGILAGVALLSA